MPLMQSAYARKPVNVPDALVDRFRAAGFKEQEPEAVEPAKADSAPAPKRRGRPRKSD